MLHKSKAKPKQRSKSYIWNVDLAVLYRKDLSASCCRELRPLVLPLSSSLLICVKNLQSMKQKEFIVLLFLIFFSNLQVFRLVAMI